MLGVHCGFPFFCDIVYGRIRDIERKAYLQKRAVSLYLPQPVASHHPFLIHPRSHQKRKRVLLNYQEKKALE
jgi:hypothetical protein